MDASDRIHQLATAFQRSRVLLTAVELDLFTALARPSTSRAVATRLKTDPRATDRLMNALVALGFLRKTAGRFSNARDTARYLVRGRPDYMAQMGHVANLWETWSTLTATVRRGRSPLKTDVRRRTAGWRERFIASMHSRASKNAPVLARILARELRGAKRILDAGGGSGGYVMGLVRACPGATGVVLDLPPIVSLTRRYIREAGMEERVSTAKGDLTRDELGRGFDLVFLSHVVHMLDPRANRALFARARRALVPGGLFVVQDFIMDEDRTTPLPGALFALNMLVGTHKGDTYTEGEVARWLRASGFEGIRRDDTSYGTTLMIGRRGR